MTSTIPSHFDLGRVRRARTLRRVGLAALTLFVLAGLSGALGTHTSEVTERGAGYELSVTYPRISRPGHAVRVQVAVHKDGGFQDAPVHLRYTTAYFEMFDENAFTPQPESETAGPGWTEDEFGAPDGDTMVMTVDTRVEPDRQHGEAGEVSVVDDDGAVLLTASFSTFIWP